MKEDEASIRLWRDYTGTTRRFCGALFGANFEQYFRTLEVPTEASNPDSAYLG
jgi:hypothetical protein